MSLSCIMVELQLRDGFCFEDLYHCKGLRRIDQSFLKFLKSCDKSAYKQLLKARQNPEQFLSEKQSHFLIMLAPYVEDFIGHFFRIEKDIMRLQTQHHKLAPIFHLKRQFIQRRAAKVFTEQEIEQFDGPLLRRLLEREFKEAFTELKFAEYVMKWLKNEEQYQQQINLALRYGAWASLNTKGQLTHKDGFLFKLPQKIDPFHLLPLESQADGKYVKAGVASEYLRRREGFKATQTQSTFEKALNQAHYCIGCHAHNKDSCSKGFKEKTGHEFQKNSQDITLVGCPLEEKISEMNVVKTQGYVVGALAIIMIDNPLVAATGDRICNHCMKACIFQKQDPVDVPLIESNILQEVLNLPWGFEIYSLLTRWNPLNFSSPLPKSPTGYKVLIVGMGPSGFTLAHYLLNEGHTVAGIDGLKIEPLPREFIEFPLKPIKSITSLYENLDQRIMAGFGGVAEYGITVRWNKNLLKVIRLILERRENFHLYGSVRLGSTLTPHQAFELGFDHIALCTGAGQPNILRIENGLARGVRLASDFLMTLQLTGAAKKDSIANLQLRLPVIVIGGGLTAIDTATEALAYYPVQVEKFLLRYEELMKEMSEEKIRSQWTEEEQEIADEFLDHGRILRAEKQNAEREGRKVNYLNFLNSWGGVTIAYRQDLTNSPSYRLNHEELFKALQEGVQFTDNHVPLKFSLDRFKHVSAMITETGKELPARSVLIAIGTQPNTMLAQEYPSLLKREHDYFLAIDENNKTLPAHSHPKAKNPQVLTSLISEGRGFSFFGDVNPAYAGSVVGAMASAKQGYPIISRLLKQQSSKAIKNFHKKLDRELCAFIYKIQRLTPSIVEIIIRSPLAARNFEPGQFYRLQNLESIAQDVKGTKLAFEALALTGSIVNLEKGYISLIVLETGASSRLCALLRPGEPVALMGPTGSPTEIVENRNVLLIGGGLGNAVLFSIGKALRAKNCKVLYIAGYRTPDDLFKREEIEASADTIVWCCETPFGIASRRSQDYSFTGTVLNGLKNYAEAGKFASQSLDRLIVIGSDSMMKAVAKATESWMKPFLSKAFKSIASINSPMQCMMKEICGQCLQSHIDPETKQESFLFSCTRQDQDLRKVDFNFLNQRLNQNSLSEKLTDLWVQSCLKEIDKTSL